MNMRSLLLVFVVLLLASSVLAIQTGKLRVKAKSKAPAVLDAKIDSETVTDDLTAEAVNTIEATEAAAAAAAASKKSSAPKAKVATKKSEVQPGSTTKKHKARSTVPAKPSEKAKIEQKPKGKKRVRTYDDLPEYAAKAKEMLAAASETSWPGQPLIQGCTPGECDAWCDECGSTSTCSNKCFLYSSCNDECP
jgi:hypothetical protein